MRYFLEIAYKGTNYHGWQIQTNAKSVQEEIQDKLKILLREEISIMGSGRTDTGVHAKQQFAHFDTEKPLSEKDFLRRINSLLPKDIAILNYFLVDKEAHARFDATKRSYEYHIYQEKNPFLQEQCYFDTRPYDIELMNLAANILLKYEDFQCFSKVHTEVNHFLCDILKAEWKNEGKNLRFYISANRFLRGMVRTIVGTLLDVGLGNMSLADFEKIIQSKDRKKAGRAVPPEGLFLTEVYYPFILSETFKPSN